MRARLRDREGADRGAEVARREGGHREHRRHGDGPVLRVEETWVRNAVETPKSQAGERTIALGKRIAEELFDYRSRTPFTGDDERVFANPRTGNAFDVGRYSELFRLALKRAGVEGRVRPFHDLRHSSITNAAGAGTPPEALMARAGHSDYATTRRYVDLAGERFREEADRLEERLWGGSGTKNRYETTLRLLNGKRWRPTRRIVPSATFRADGVVGWWRADEERDRVGAGV